MFLFRRAAVIFSSRALPENPVRQSVWYCSITPPFFPGTLGGCLFLLPAPWSIPGRFPLVTSFFETPPCFLGVESSFPSRRLHLARLASPPLQGPAPPLTMHSLLQFCSVVRSHLTVVFPHLSPPQRSWPTASFFSAAMGQGVFPVFEKCFPPPPKVFPAAGPGFFPKITQVFSGPCCAFRLFSSHFPVLFGAGRKGPLR